MSLSWLVYAVILKHVFANFNCENLASSKSGTDDDDETWVECSSEYPTMVSCGFAPYDATVSNIDGSWMEKVNGVNRCYAKNGQGGNGVMARARCCDFTHLGDVDCVTTNFGSVSGDDNTITGQCSGTYKYLTGCSVESSWRNFDGSYFGSTEPSLYSFSPRSSSLFIKCVLQNMQVI